MNGYEVLRDTQAREDSWLSGMGLQPFRRRWGGCAASPAPCSFDPGKHDR
ncbi:hypothetical protein JCM12141A_57960 [Mycolicibacterium hodleri]